MKLKKILDDRNLTIQDFENFGATHFPKGDDYLKKECLRFEMCNGQFRYLYEQNGKKETRTQKGSKSAPIRATNLNLSDPLILINEGEPDSAEATKKGFNSICGLDVNTMSNIADHAKILFHPFREKELLTVVTCFDNDNAGRQGLTFPH